MTDLQIIKEKLTQTAVILDELGIDLWLTFVRESSMNPDPAMELIAGLDVTWESAFLISPTRQPIAIVGRYDAAPFEEIGIYNVISYDENIAPVLQAQIEAWNPKNIALNYSEGDVSADGLTLGLYRNLCHYLPDYVDRFISAESVIHKVRGRKSQTEIERVRQAVLTTEQLFDEIEAFVKVGMTQKQISDFVQGRIAELGLGYAWPKDHNPIVTCGPHSSVGHAVPGHVPIEQGHLLHIDLGITQNGYSSDIQRMWYVLEDGESKPPIEVQHAFDVVYGAIKAGESELQPDKLGWEVDAVARDFIVDNGYPEYKHAFGHLLGRAAHDGATVLGPQWPRYKDICELPVEVGNIFTLELHVMVEGRGMMSLEEDVLVTNDGVRYLSKPQTALRLIQG